MDMDILMSAVGIVRKQITNQVNKQQDVLLVFQILFQVFLCRSTELIAGWASASSIKN